MRLGISEILERVEQAPTDDIKVDLLRQHSTPQLQNILRHFYDPSIKFLLPANVKYQNNSLADCENVLYHNQRLLYLFVEGGHPKLAQKRREELFVQFIEGLSPADAELMIALKDKRMPYESVTKELVLRAFPTLRTLLKE